MAARATHPRLVWPRSDGDPSRWPQTGESAGNTPWFDEIGNNRKKLDTYEITAGEHLAAKLGIAPLGGGLKHRIPLPEGFKLFVHKQPRADGSIREDYYLFGSRYNSRIRSAQEWKDHAEWLFDESKPMEKHNQECICDRKNKRAAIASGSQPGTPSQATASAPAVPKRAPVVPRKSLTVKKPRMSPESDEAFPTGVVPDRASDLGTQRRFRRGELVWLRINAIEPAPGSKSPAITHWPALVAEIRHKSREAPAKTATGFGSFVNGGMVHYYWQHHLRPLGMFDKQHDVVRDAKDLLPWAVGLDLLGGQEGRTALANEGADVMKAGIAKEVQDDREASTEARWASLWGKRKRFEDMLNVPDPRPEAAFRLVVAIRTGTVISQSWCQTDRIDAIPEAVLSQADRDLLNANKKSLFQGLWLGGERIWAEDVVRIKQHRKKLPSGLAPLGLGTGAEDRAVFLRIHAIALETHNMDDPKTESWKCLLYGDLAELVTLPPRYEHSADSGWAPFTPTSGVPNPLVQNYKAPKGFMFRQINTDDSQVTCDIGDVAGRMYPDLLDETTQTWYGMQAPRAPAGEKAFAVMGLRPGVTAASENQQWMEDLFAIVDRATKTVEGTFSTYYATELQKMMKRDPSTKPPGWVSPAAQAAKATAGNATTAASDLDPVLGAQSKDAVPPTSATIAKPASKGAAGPSAGQENVVNQGQNGQTAGAHTGEDAAAGQA